MNDDDSPSQVVRARSAKRGGIGNAFDGGAVAAGLAVALLAFAVTLFGGLDGVIGISIVGAGVFVGGFVTSQLRRSNARCPACHGFVVSILFLFVVALVVISAGMAESDAPAITAFAIGQSNLAVILFLVLGAGTMGARFGRYR